MKTANRAVKYMTVFMRSSLGMCAREEAFTRDTQNVSYLGMYTMYLLKLVVARLVDSFAISQGFCEPS